MEFLSKCIEILLHLDVHLNEWVALFGPWSYVILFLVIFCETGLVVTPFLPGDSLLFALGALTAGESSYLNLPLLSALLITAAILGNIVNYSIGRYVGPKVFKQKSSFLLNHQHLVRSQEFYEKHGGKTIILTRFIPIIRTFAPFVAGIGQMHYFRFMSYNVVGALAWVLLFLIAGNQFGNLPSVKQNFHIVIFAIILISFLPVVVEFIRNRAHKQKSSA